jgi:ATP-dependent protease ClpP protease subunit
MEEYFGLDEMPDGGRIFTASKGNHHTIYLDTDIGPPNLYREELQLLNNALPSDSFDIIINGGGGYMNTAVCFINAIRGCEGVVTTVLEQEAFSAHSMIFLAADNCIVQPHSSLMLHMGSGGQAGKMSDTIKQAVHYKEVIDDLMRDIYYGFCTEDEINALIRGEDMWMRDQEIVDRLKRKADVLKHDYENSVNDIIDEEVEKEYYEGFRYKGDVRDNIQDNVDNI